METRNLKISFNKSGAGNITPKVALPATWIKEMGIDADNRDIEVNFDGETITIKRK
ncbi:MAG: AbrB/MazE/SpoVT family DNA-binding domain-containing protein [Terrisporobacter sp.]